MGPGLGAHGSGSLYPLTGTCMATSGSRMPRSLGPRALGKPQVGSWPVPSCVKCFLRLWPETNAGVGRGIQQSLNKWHVTISA